MVFKAPAEITSDILVPWIVCYAVSSVVRVLSCEPSESSWACAFKVTLLALANNFHVLIRAIRLRRIEINEIEINEANHVQSVHLRRTGIETHDDSDVHLAVDSVKLLKHRKNLERSTRTMRGMCQHMQTHTHTDRNVCMPAACMHAGIYATIAISTLENLPMGILMV